MGACSVSCQVGNPGKALSESLLPRRSLISILLELLRLARRARKRKFCNFNVTVKSL